MHPSLGIGPSGDEEVCISPCSGSLTRRTTHTHGTLSTTYCAPHGKTESLMIPVPSVGGASWKIACD